MDIEPLNAIALLMFLSILVNYSNTHSQVDGDGLREDWMFTHVVDVFESKQLRSFPPRLEREQLNVVWQCACKP